MATGTIIQGSNNPLRFLDNSGESQMLRLAGRVQVSDDAGQNFRDITLARDFEEETLIYARLRYTQWAPLWRCTGSDFTGQAVDNVAAGFGWVNPSVYNTSWSGGAYTLSNSAAFLNNKNPIITHPRGEPWLVRVRVRFNGTTFASGGFNQFITLSNAAGTHVIELINNGASTQLGLTLLDAAGSSGFISGGPDFVLGSTNFPNNAYCTLTLRFNPGDTIRWEANDVINPANALTQAQLDHLVDEPMVVYSGSLDAGQAVVDALACAYVVAP